MASNKLAQAKALGVIALGFVYVGFVVLMCVLFGDSGFMFSCYIPIVGGCVLFMIGAGLYLAYKGLYRKFS